MNKGRSSYSVIIPVFNGEKYLDEAISSVLAQTLKPEEIIIVDDGSTDSTAEVVKKYHGSVHYSYQSNKGAAAARNTGLRMAQCDFISFIDADDIWVMDKIEKQMRLFEQHPEAEIIIGLLMPVSAKAPGRDISKLAKKNLLLPSLGSSLIRKTVFEKIGNFDEQLALAEDTDWFFRARESGITVFVQNEIVQYYRIHDKNSTRDKNITNFNILLAFKKSLDRRRKSGE